MGTPVENLAEKRAADRLSEAAAQLQAVADAKNAGHAVARAMPWTERLPTVRHNPKSGIMAVMPTPA